MTRRVKTNGVITTKGALGTWGKEAPSLTTMRLATNRGELVTLGRTEELKYTAARRVARGFHIAEDNVDNSSCDHSTDHDIMVFGWLRSWVRKAGGCPLAGDYNAKIKLRHRRHHTQKKAGPTLRI